jgi:hypothetical protein
METLENPKTSKKGGRPPYPSATRLRITDDTRLLASRHLLEKQEQGELIFETVRPTAALGHDGSA